MSLFHEANQPALDANGDPIPGATWDFYLTDTLTPASVYSDASLSTSVGSNLTADSSGRFAVAYLDDDLTYRAVLKDVGGSTITDIDPVNVKSQMSSIGLKVEAEGLYIPPRVTRVQTTGYHTAGVGAAWYYHSVAENPDLTTYPRLGFTDASGRKFRLDTTNYPFTPYVYGVPTGGPDPTEALQAYFDYMTANSVAMPYLIGGFTVTDGIVWGNPDGTNSVTRRFDGGTFSLTAGAEMDNLLTITNLPSAQIRCRIQLRGGSSLSANYSTRTQCAVGLRIVDSRQLALDDLFIQGFWFAGVHADGEASSNSNFVRIGSIEADYCGSGNSASGQSLISIYSNPVNTGSANSTSQYTTISLATMPPPALFSDNVSGAPSTLNNFQVRISDELYTIIKADYVTNTLRIYPWLNSATPASGTLSYVWGGAVDNRGECNCWTIGVLEAGSCGRGGSFGALYGPTINLLSSQDNGQGACFGGNPAAACRGTHILNFYTEAEDEKLVFVNRFGGNNTGRISSTYSLKPIDVIATGQARDGSNNRTTDTSAINNWTIFYSGADVVY
ncbi:hypothetical protein [Sphingosinicella terrae]|uniref:hypothetical protein n=1 Tax=Sphingosinicella terrae TaxID=2172047 RepID=UPI0013B3E158|nr:hypothetical protein [Sphingosinicella terrae]